MALSLCSNVPVLCYSAFVACAEHNANEVKMNMKLTWSHDTQRSDGGARCGDDDDDPTSSTFSHFVDGKKFTDNFTSTLRSYHNITTIYIWARWRCNRNQPFSFHYAKLIDSVGGKIKASCEFNSSWAWNDEFGNFRNFNAVNIWNFFFEDCSFSLKFSHLTFLKIFLLKTKQW